MDQVDYPQRTVAPLVVTNPVEVSTLSMAEEKL
jgi:hypothetical protein